MLWRRLVAIALVVFLSFIDGAPVVPTTAPVVVAAQDLAAGIELQNYHLRVVQVPVADQPSGAVADAKTLVGQTLMQVRLDGEAIGTRMVGPPVVLLAHERAIFLPLQSLSNLFGPVKLGDAVDLVGKFKQPFTSRAEVALTVRIPNVRVFGLSPEFRENGQGNALLAFDARSMPVLYRDLEDSSNSFTWHLSPDEISFMGNTLEIAALIHSVDGTFTLAQIPEDRIEPRHSVWVTWELRAQ